MAHVMLEETIQLKQKEKTAQFPHKLQLFGKTTIQRVKSTKTGDFLAVAQHSYHEHSHLQISNENQKFTASKSSNNILSSKLNNTTSKDMQPQNSYSCRYILRINGTNLHHQILTHYYISTKKERRGIQNHLNMTTNYFPIQVDTFLLTSWSVTYVSCFCPRAFN